MTYTNFIPLIGPFHWVAKEMGMECVQTVSFPKMQDNEQHIKANDPNAPDVVLYPNELLDDFNFSLDEHRKLFIENNLKKTDFVFGLPPCSGFSQMSTKTGADQKANICMIELIKYYLVSDSDILLFENAPGLAGEKGQVFLRDYVYKMLEENNLTDIYKFNLIKTDTDQHGLPQHRPRTFLIMYKSDKHKKIIYNKKIECKKIEDLFKDLSFEENESSQHFYLRSKYSDDFLSFINESDKAKKVLEEIKEKFKDKRDWRYDIISTFARKVLDNEDVLDEKYPTVYEGLTKLKSKIISKGAFTFRDSGPILFKDYTSAIVGKNNWNLVREFDGRYRYLTMREKMRLMGYPDSFMIVNPVKNNNHICQNAPLTTVKSSIEWAIQIFNNENVEDIDLNKKGIFLFQNNTKSDMTNELYYYNNGFIKLNKIIEKDIFDGYI